MLTCQMSPGFPQSPGQATPLRLCHSSPYRDYHIRIRTHNGSHSFVLLYLDSAFRIRPRGFDNRAEILEKNLKSSFFFF